MLLTPARQDDLRPRMTQPACPNTVKDMDIRRWSNVSPLPIRAPLPLRSQTGFVTCHSDSRYPHRYVAKLFKEHFNPTMPIQTTSKIWHNGNLIPWEQATLHVMSHVVHYGSSVFEGIRCYRQPQGSAVFRLPEHMQRMLDSAKIYRMDLPFTLEELCAGAVELIEANGVTPCYIRPIALRGYGEIGVSPKGSPIEVYMANFPWGKYIAGTDGADVCISSWNRLAPNTMPALAKAGANYMNSQLIHMEAEINGYAEGIGLDVNGLVSEGSGENIFVVRNGVLYTPPLANSALSGITRDSVLTIARHLGMHGHRAGAAARAALHRRRGLLHRHGGGGVADPLDRPHRDRRRKAGRDHQDDRRGVLRHRQRAQAGPLWLADAGECESR